ncbi:MAG TPA: cyclase family protein [Anaerolineaceae bacterium]
MQIWDISVTIDPNLPVWLGDPPFNIERVQKIEEGANANVSRIVMGVHTGTHVDAPFHFLMDGAKVETLALDVLIGPAVVVQIPDPVNVLDKGVIDAAGIPAGAERILFKTRSSGYWSKFGAEFQTDFVAIDASGAQALVDRGVKLVGIDYLSISPYKNSRPTHQILLASKAIIIEGLDLSKIEPGEYQLICLPVKLGGAEGAPARTVLTRG